MAVYSDKWMMSEAHIYYTGVIRILRLNALTGLIPPHKSLSQRTIKHI